MKTKLLIFGITGDLGTRKLLPALEQIISTGDFNELSVIGVSRRSVNRDDLFLNCKSSSFLDDKLSFFEMDLAKLDDYIKLKSYISLDDSEQLLVYLAIPPQSTSGVVGLLGETGLNTQNVKILFEKPFGIDLNSASYLINQTGKYYKEEQTYRIDHFLAKEMSQNLIAFRSRNAIFNNIWNSDFIDSIEIISTQKMGIEGRSHFYEQTGALRDVLQGHLMQLLALILMDIPPEFEWEDVPALRLQALNEIKRVDIRSVVRGQYEGYRQEVGNINSMTETYVSINLESVHPNWQGVPIKLSTGKALDVNTTEMRIYLKKTNKTQSNCVIFNIQPNEGIDIELSAKKPGYNQECESHHLSFSYPPDTKLPDAYEQVIVDAISSKKSLFASSDEVLQSWRILQPILDNWNKTNDDLIAYKKGTSFNKNSVE